MGAIKLELRCPQSVNGIEVDPQPDWSFDSLMSELNSIEKKLNPSSSFPLPFTKTHAREFSAVKELERSPSAFIMRVSDDEIEDINGDEYHNLIVSTRFACDDLSISDSDEDEDDLTLGTQCVLMNKGGLVEGALSELTNEHQLSVTEEVRNQILTLETDLVNEDEKFTAALARVEKYNEARRDMDRRLDMQYQREIAEALDNHLTAIQRDHEHRSQIEERRIRADAATEEAKRKEKAFQEEKVRQEKFKAETEAKARLEAERKRAEEAKAAALDAEKKAAKEAAEKVAIENSERAPLFSSVPNKVEPTVPGDLIKGADSALKVEERRLQIYKEVAAQNEALGYSSNKDYRSHGMQIARRIKQITGTRESVRGKADELIKLISNSPYPQSISIALFAEKMVSHCENNSGSFSNSIYAYAHVIVLVTSKVPGAMEILLAELNRSCIYTVPKHISYAKATFETKEAYYKAIGFREEDGKMESKESYVDRISSYMKLYGALVQTEAEGAQNLHGIKEGWAWLARFLNALPANLYSAVALQGFLEMAGFALYRRYKSQFKKLVNTVYHKFLKSLTEKREDPRLKMAIMGIKNYIESDQFLKEPEGWRLLGSLLSHSYHSEQDHQKQQYYHQSNSYQRSNTYQR